MGCFKCGESPRNALPLRAPQIHKQDSGAAATITTAVAPSLPSGQRDANRRHVRQAFVSLEVAEQTTSVENYKVKTTHAHNAQPGYYKEEPPERGTLATSLFVSEATDDPSRRNKREKINSAANGRSSNT